eukprot:Phypoly_transcript_05639.p1 GENE.Phypoly_transcript_05639~~Phypoly_transcript_05639.p1  ORF type:complete len:386 (+),score=18.40 Phypoly_transcript_05639:283-1440(+)
MNWTLTLLAFSAYLHTAASLLIRFSNGTNLTLQSTYSTLGIAPNLNITFPNITYLADTDINGETCSPTKNISQNFVIYVHPTTPDMTDCCTDAVFGSDLALAKTLDKYGALGVLFQAREKYAGGRVQGFEHVIRIPIGVVSYEVMSFLKQHRSSIASLDFVEIPQEDKDAIAYLNYMYSTVVLVYVVVYGALMVLMAFSLIIDIVRLYKSFREKPHIICLKVGGLATATSTYLWLTVDPFGFHGYTYWQSCLLYNIQNGLYTVICMLVLLLLLLSSNHKHPKCIAFSIYGGIVLVLSVSVIQGILCSSDIMGLIYSLLNILAITAISIGFIFFAKETISTFVKSNNKGRRASVLPVKVCPFPTFFFMLIFTIREFSQLLHIQYNY